MKIREKVNVLLIAIFALFLQACEKEKVAVDYSSENEWIETQMREWYYWYNEIPDKATLDFNEDASTFFNSLLSEKDGKKVDDGHRYYSYLEDKKTDAKSYKGGDPSLGFEFGAWRNKTSTVFGANILYTLPGSLAEKEGLRRGDWIVTINDKPMKSSDFDKLLSGTSIKLGISDDLENPVKRTVTLNFEIVPDNPVYLDTVLNTSDFDPSLNYPQNVKIGYLVYNHFTAGINDKDESYDDSMREAFARINTEDVDEFILDLRYNSGGLVTCAQLLATMLAPASALDQEFCHLKYNDKQSKQNKIYKLDRSCMEAGANINLKRLYVITSKSTASASEAVINGLLPYMPGQIFLIGEKTEGKNVGSITIESEKYKHVLHPIVCQLYNVKGETDYQDGFDPVGASIQEDGSKVRSFGDPKDFYLGMTLDFMLLNKIPENTQKSKAFGEIQNTFMFSSLDRKKINGVIIPTSSLQ